MSHFLGLSDSGKSLRLGTLAVPELSCLVLSIPFSGLNFLTGFSSVRVVDISEPVLFPVTFCAIDFEPKIEVRGKKTVVTILAGKRLLINLFLNLFV